MGGFFHLGGTRLLIGRKSSLNKGSFSNKLRIKQIEGKLGANFIWSVKSMAVRVSTVMGVLAKKICQ